MREREFDNRNDHRVYVGNLPPDIRPREVEDLFFKYGKIVQVELKNKRGPPYAFVEFEDARDCKAAVEGKHGTKVDGYRLRVELPRGVGPRGPSGIPLEGGRTGFRRLHGNTGHRLIVSGLPSRITWQDLKDYMKTAGEITYTDVYHDGTGVVEFEKLDDMKWALKTLDDTKLRTRAGTSGYIRLERERASKSRRSRSRSASLDHRRERSPLRSARSRSGSRSRY